MNNNSSVENSIKLGLKESEAKVYINLLKKKNFTATEIARVSSVPRTKIYEILHQLANKGLCVEILGGVKKYSPVNPKIAFKGLLQRYEQDYQQEIEFKKILVSNISETLLPLYHSEKENTDPLNYIQVVRENNIISERVKSLGKMLKHEMLSFTKAPYAMSSNIAEFEIVFINLKKGIKYKTVYEAIDARKSDFMKMIETFASAGEEARIVNSLPLKLEIYDRKLVVFALEDMITSKPSLTSMVIEHPDLAKTLEEVFYTYWKKGMTLEEFKIKEKIS